MLLKKLNVSNKQIQKIYEIDFLQGGWGPAVCRRVALTAGAPKEFAILRNGVGSFRGITKLHSMGLAHSSRVVALSLETIFLQCSGEAGGKFFSSNSLMTLFWNRRLGMIA